MKNRQLLGLYVLFYIYGVFFSLTPVYAQLLDYNKLKAQEQLRIGVNRFHQGYYSDTILALQRALSFDSQNLLIHTWLGNAYYNLGFQEAALYEWDKVIKSGENSLALANFVNHIRAREGIMHEVSEDSEYVEVARIKGTVQNRQLFKNPANLYPNGDGMFYLTSFGNNRLFKLNQNGLITNQSAGRALSFHNPFDVIKVNDLLYVTEYGSNTIAVVNQYGFITQQFGGTGNTDGLFLGPQYLTHDEQFLYITDYGNQRVQKFQLNGDFIIQFGSVLVNIQSNKFSGFHSIRGIVYIGNNELVIADEKDGVSILYHFDTQGNFIKRSNSLLSSRLKNIEDMQFIPEDNSILITTNNTILKYILDTQEIMVLYEDTDNPNVQFLSAMYDDNKNLIVSDFNNPDLLVLNQLSDVYSGLYVQVDSIKSNDFPEVTVEFTVQDSSGMEIIGLEAQNFVISEGEFEIPVEASLIYQGIYDASVTAQVIIESSPALLEDEQLSFFSAGIGKYMSVVDELTSYTVLSAGEVPGIEGHNSFVVSSLAYYNKDEKWSFDLALRNAMIDLQKEQTGKRVIIFISSGELLPSWAFDNYELLENYLYMRNHGIQFSVIQATNKKLDENLQFLVKNTGGKSYFILQKNGLVQFRTSLLQQRNGKYIMRYKSQLDFDFGRKYLPVQVTAYLLNRSGKMESGYYAPLVF